jgi:hypothetical protein
MLRYTNCYYCVPVHMPSQIYPIYVMSCYFMRVILIVSYHVCARVLNSSIQFFPQKLNKLFLISHACYVPRPSHLPWFDHSYSIWRRMKMMELLFSLLCYCFFSVHNHSILWESGKQKAARCRAPILKHLYPNNPRLPRQFPSSHRSVLPIFHPHSSRLLST